MEERMTTVREAEMHVFEERCYEAYKLQWMLSHGNTVTELFNTMTDIAIETVEENPMDAATDESSTKSLMRNARKTFVSEMGFDGSLWVCKEEFLQSEFKDVEYMHQLFTMMDGGPVLREFYDEHYPSGLTPYYVTMRVEGRFVAEVFAKNGISEAKELAVEKYTEADFGPLEDIDGDCVKVEDADGNYLWEAGGDEE